VYVANDWNSNVFPMDIFPMGIAWPAKLVGLTREIAVWRRRARAEAYRQQNLKLVKAPLQPDSSLLHLLL
jgi:hypothetical protein